jgi:hypothetical protein
MEKNMDLDEYDFLDEDFLYSFTDEEIKFELECFEEYKSSVDTDL